MFNDTDTNLLIDTALFATSLIFSAKHRYGAEHTPYNLFALILRSHLCVISHFLLNVLVSQCLLFIVYCLDSQNEVNLWFFKLKLITKK